MKRQTKFRYVWIALNFLILALPVFIPSTSIDFIGILTVLMLLLSYPLAMILLWLTFGWVDGSIGSMYLMLFAFSVLAYVQWFVLVPRALRFIKTKFFSKDVQINFSANIETIKSLPVPNAEFYTNNVHRKNFYDEQQRTPVERVFDERDD